MVLALAKPVGTLAVTRLETGYFLRLTYRLVDLGDMMHVVHGKKGEVDLMSLLKENSKGCGTTWYDVWFSRYSNDLMDDMLGIF